MSLECERGGLESGAQCAKRDREMKNATRTEQKDTTRRETRKCWSAKQSASRHARRMRNVNRDADSGRRRARFRTNKHHLQHTTSKRDMQEVSLECEIAVLKLSSQRETRQRNEGRAERHNKTRKTGTLTAHEHRVNTDRTQQTRRCDTQKQPKQARARGSAHLGVRRVHADSLR